MKIYLLQFQNTPGEYFSKQKTARSALASKFIDMKMGGMTISEYDDDHFTFYYLKELGGTLRIHTIEVNEK